MSELEVVGRVFSEDGTYRPSELVFTLIEGRSVALGEIVCIRHPTVSGAYVFYQVVDVPLRRKVKVYEEDLIRANRPVEDPERNYPRARATQIGYVDPETNEVKPLLEHVRPLCEVYRPTPEMVECLLRPRGDRIYVSVGKIYPKLENELYLDLGILLRQGLLIIGGVGTGKTTTMITLLITLLEECVRHGLRPHLLIVDKDGEYGCGELKEAAELAGGYVYVPVSEVGFVETYTNPDALHRRLVEVTGIHPSSKLARELKSAVQKLFASGNVVKLDEELLRRLQDAVPHNVRGELRQRLERAREVLVSASAGVQYSIDDVLDLVSRSAVVHLDCSTAETWDQVLKVVSSLLDSMYARALQDKSFGCLVVIDEVHFYAPEKGMFRPASESLHERMRDILIGKIATTGARNGVVLFVTTQRLSLVAKTLSTQVGQNLIAHKVEDVDLERLKEIAGSELVEAIRLLPRGYALVKATANPIGRPMIVKLYPRARPLSTATTCLSRWARAERPSLT